MILCTPSIPDGQPCVVRQRQSRLPVYFLSQLLAAFTITAHWNVEALSTSPLSASSILVGVGKVAIVLPTRQSELTLLEGNGSTCDENYSTWYDEAIVDLPRLGLKLNIPILEPDDGMLSNGGREYRHFLTAVPDRTGTYALAIREVTADPSADTSGPDPSRKTKKRSRGKRNRQSKNEPLFIDLCPPSDTRMGHRLNKHRDGGELLLKALGLGKLVAERSKADTPVVVYDLTAGFARDSLVVLASQYLRQGPVSSPSTLVLMVERDPIVAELLSDAMRRLKLLACGSSNGLSIAELDKAKATGLAASLFFESGDAASVLERMQQMQERDGRRKNLSQAERIDENPTPPWPPDVCYLDPMFPPRTKSAAVKKDMAMLHSLLGTASKHEAILPPSELEGTGSGAGSVSSRIQDERVLLNAACRAALKRVVVKRPINAPPLGFLNSCGAEIDTASAVKDVANTCKPSYAVRGSANRWDIYVLN